MRSPSPVLVPSRRSSRGPAFLAGTLALVLAPAALAAPVGSPSGPPPSAPSSANAGGSPPGSAAQAGKKAPDKAAPPPDKSEKELCVEASEEAQKRRSAGELRRARERLLVCARDVCPGVVRKDCSEWLTEVERAMPSLLVVVQTADGRDVTDASIYLDGEVVPPSAESRGLPVDPGRHTLAVVLADGTRLEETVVVREGEQKRPVTFRPKGSSSEPAPVAARGGAPVAAWISAGVGVAALGAFVGLGIAGRSEVSHLRETCAPSCLQSDVDAARAKLIAADISLGIGIVATGVATWLFFTAPEPAPRRSVGWAVVPSPTGAAAQVGGQF